MTGDPLGKSRLANITPATPITDAAMAAAIVAMRLPDILLLRLEAKRSEGLVTCAISFDAS